MLRGVTGNVLDGDQETRGSVDQRLREATECLGIEHGDVALPDVEEAVFLQAREGPADGLELESIPPAESRDP